MLFTGCATRLRQPRLNWRNRAACHFQQSPALHDCWSIRMLGTTIVLNNRFAIHVRPKASIGLSVGRVSPCGTYVVIHCSCASAGFSSKASLASPMGTDAVLGLLELTLCMALRPKRFGTGTRNKLQDILGIRNLFWGRGRNRGRPPNSMIPAYKHFALGAGSRR